MICSVFWGDSFHGFSLFPILKWEDLDRIALESCPAFDVIALILKPPAPPSISVKSPVRPRREHEGR